MRSPSWSISSIAARSAPTRAPATAPASWCRSRTPSSPRKPKKLGFTLPAPGHYAVGFLFLPRDQEWRDTIRKTYEEVAAQEGMKILGWRDVPTDNSTLGESVKPTEPVHMQVFVERPAKIKSEQEFERRLYHHAQGDLERDLSAARAPAVRLLPGVAVLPHDHLQGHVPRRPARRLLSRICTIRISSARWRWCISASRPTPSRPGRSRIRIASSPITAKSTRCAAT